MFYDRFMVSIKENICVDRRVAKGFWVRHPYALTPPCLGVLDKRYPGLMTLTLCLKCVVPGYLWLCRAQTSIHIFQRPSIRLWVSLVTVQITSKLWDCVEDLQRRSKFNLENINNIALVEQKECFSVNLLKDNLKNQRSEVWVLKLTYVYCFQRPISFQLHELRSFYNSI